MLELNGTQVRQLIDTEQLYGEWRRTDRERRTRFAGSMAWKIVSGRRYLYRKQNGVWRSLGPEGPETTLTHQRFHAGRDVAKSRLASLDAEIRRNAPVNRAMRLGRVPWMTARILRRLDALGVLGYGLGVAGTHAVYAYERLAGVHLESDVVATLDIDLLYDARGRLDLIGSGLARTGLLGVLQDLDASFASTGAGSFRAANADGFMVDLIMPTSRRRVTNGVRHTLSDTADDLSAVEIDGLGWLESSPIIEVVAIDERGYPLTIVAPDPRAFVCHKLWVADRVDREPVKARRDRAQAIAVAMVLQTHLPNLSFADPMLGAMPQDLRDRASRLTDESLANPADADDPGGWT